MAYQNLFEALQRVAGFTALETDMMEIIDAVRKDGIQPQEHNCNAYWIQMDTQWKKCSECGMIKPSLCE